MYLFWSFEVCELELKQRHKGFVGGPTINCDSDGTFAPTQCEGAFLGSEYVYKKCLW